MRSFVFDDKGKTWDAKSPHLAEALHASIGGEQLLSYVVRNLGFVAVAANDGSVRIRLRPAVVSQIAFGALLYWLHDRKAERIMLSFLDREWSHALVRSREDAVSLLVTRVSSNPHGREGDFLNRPRPLHDLPSSCPLRAVLDAWAQCAGKYDPETLHPLLQKALNGRFVLVEASASTPTLFLRDIGNGFTQLADYWLSRAIGRKVEDQPDYAYGKWVAGLYRQALNTREPCLEDVDAVVTWPDQPRKSYRYRRLVLPFEHGRDSATLLGATLVDPNIDLRIKTS